MCINHLTTQNARTCPVSLMLSGLSIAVSRCSSITSCTLFYSSVVHITTPINNELMPSFILLLRQHVIQFFNPHTFSKGIDKFFCIFSKCLLSCMGHVCPPRAQKKKCFAIRQHSFPVMFNDFALLYSSFQSKHPVVTHSQTQFENVLNNLITKGQRSPI